MSRNLSSSQRSRENEGGATDRLRAAWAWAVGGAILGLIVGLLIGWVFWPVKWTGGGTPADLAPSAKADYLASVADAYVAARSQSAADLARQRVAVFGDDLPLELDAARIYFANGQEENRAVRVNNLTELASVLNLELPPSIAGGEAVGQAQPNEASSAQPNEVVVPDVTPVFDAGEEPAGASSVWSWIRWFFVSLAALVLIGGGIFVLRLLYRQSQGVTGVAHDLDAVDEFVDEDDFQSAAAVNVDHGAGINYANVEAELEEHRRRAALPSGASARPVDPADADYAFQEEPTHLPRAGTVVIDVPRADSSLSAPVPPAEQVATQAESAGWREEESNSIFRDDADDDFDDDFDDDVDEHFEDMSDDGGDRDVTGVVYHVVNDDTAARGISDQGRAMREAAPRSRGRALATFTAHYVLGIPEYDESFNILDADATSYIGECGMGYNTKNGILQNNPENVIALDVWLFDKTDEKQLETKTRVLISQHVLDNHLERVFGDPENPDKRPIVAVEDRQFALEGSNLVLDCTIARVGHSADGIFQDVVVEMVVSRKR